MVKIKIAKVTEKGKDKMPTLFAVLYKRAMCIKGLIWPPLQTKKKLKVAFDWFIRRITKVYNSGIYLTMNRCYGNRNGR